MQGLVRELLILIKGKTDREKQGSDTDSRLETIVAENTQIGIGRHRPLTGPSKRKMSQDPELSATSEI